MRIRSLRGVFATAAAAVTLGAIGGFAHVANATPAHTTPDSPLTVSYIVTPDESTAVNLGITYQDNEDYELDHLNTGSVEYPDADPTHYCFRFRLATSHTEKPSARNGLRAPKPIMYTWYECYDVPVNEAPRTPEYN